MEAEIIKLLVILLFGLVVGGGVYLVLFVAEARDDRRTRATALAAEVAEGTGRSGDSSGDEA